MPESYPSEAGRLDAIADELHALAAEDVADTMRVVRRVLLEGGINEPERGIHSWRCAHPDLYGPCTCVADLMDDLAAALRERAK